MPISDHLTHFEGLPVVNYSADKKLHSPERNAFRLSIDWETHEAGQTFVDLFAAFVADPGCAEVSALLIGDWGEAGAGNDSAPVVEALVSARDRLPKLRALFLGEMVMEESEISWITQSDVSPLFEAFPNLEALYLRGGNGLRLGRPRHHHLRTLVIQTGGMPAPLVHELIEAELPRLQHLELWLGDDAYGNDVSSDDLRRLLSQGLCQQLTYLGLRDDCRADETAKLLAEMGVPDSLETLDLSLGILGDEGANALAESPWLKQLKRLDIHYHFVSDEVVARLRSIVGEVDANDRQEPEEWDGEDHRYVAVGE